MGADANTWNAAMARAAEIAEYYAENMNSQGAKRAAEQILACRLPLPDPALLNLSSFQMPSGKYAQSLGDVALNAARYCYLRAHPVFQVKELPNELELLDACIDRYMAGEETEL